MLLFIKKNVPDKIKIKAINIKNRFLFIFKKKNPNPKKYKNKILNMQESNNLIMNLISMNKPLMITRIGSGELEIIYHYYKYRKNKKKPRHYIEDSVKHLANNGGFFSIEKEEYIDKFCEIYLKCIKNIDILGVWFNFFEDIICNKICPDAKLVPLAAIEPYYHENPYSVKFKNKKILVIHPFENSIKKQFIKRKKLFNNLEILPDFDLKTIRAIQSIGNLNIGFNTWFEALDDMYKEIDKTDFDIAIIGAGAYGLPLASYIKQKGKIAIHLAGATQILFGIKGKRWDNNPIISKLYNEFWINPSEDEKPINYKSVEDGCYW